MPGNRNVLAAMPSTVKTAATSGAAAPDRPIEDKGIGARIFNPKAAELVKFSNTGVARIADEESGGARSGSHLPKIC